MYKVKGIQKQLVECEISSNQVANILQQEYFKILGCTLGDMLCGELRKEGNLILRRDNSIFKELTEEEHTYATTLQAAIKYFINKEKGK